MYPLPAFITAHPSTFNLRFRRPVPLRCAARPIWRASVSSNGIDPPKPSDPPSEPHSSSSPSSSSPPASPSQDCSPDFNASPLKSFGEPEIAVDPLKNVPAALIDASGALQVDDGSLDALPILPRRLVRRSKRGLDLQSLRRQLASGFDSGVGAAILLVSLFGIWYWSNTAFNVFNKQILRAFPYPLTCTLLQFFVASLVMASTWVLRLKSPPALNTFTFTATAPLAALHAAGFWLTNMSLGRVSVAFTHTVKSTEPFFSVALTPSILGDIPTWGILGSLFPIVAGVALASANDVSFNWPGFLSALGSNLAMQSRNVLSKRLMDAASADAESSSPRRGWQSRALSDEEHDALATLDNVNMFAAMSILAFLILIPPTLALEGMPLLTAATASATTGMSMARLMRLQAISGVCRCMDVLASYMILKRVSPVTHSIGNCVKRAVVIVVSIFFFQTRMNTLNIVGTALALTGVLVYSLIVSACKQNSFGPDSPICRPIYDEDDVELTEGGGI